MRELELIEAPASEVLGTAAARGPIALARRRRRGRARPAATRSPRSTRWSTGSIPHRAAAPGGDRPPRAGRRAVGPGGDGGASRARRTWRSACPAGTELEDALALARGAQALAASYGVTIAGGDVTRGADADVTVHRRRLGRRSRRAGRSRRRTAGDLVAVTGTLGGAGAGLALLDGAGRRRVDRRAGAARCASATPRPRAAPRGRRWRCARSAPRR